jgi:mono/diheme cytochrome c family protein
VYSTNITPDADTGIGRWSLADFTRSMREGVDRRGAHLYPAFPYDHFTRVTDDDLQAIYAFVMSRDPVQARSPRNDLIFPFNLRVSAAAWKLLFFKPEVFRPDPAQSAEWNRGFYLAQGLGHCGACHTPRNALGAEKDDEAYAGGEAEGWHAPALNQASPAPFPWTVERLVQYLRTGADEVHGAAAGPMAPVVHDLSQVPEQDVRAIAVYIASLDPRPAAEREKRAEELAARSTRSPRQDAGERIYAGACAECHGATRRDHGGLKLSLSSALALPTPANTLRVIRNGIVPPEGERGPWMPPFAGSLTDAQLADLVDYLRRRFTGQPAWNDVPGELKKIAREDAKQKGGT